MKALKNQVNRGENFKCRMIRNEMLVYLKIALLYKDKRYKRSLNKGKTIEVKKILAKQKVNIKRLNNNVKNKTKELKE